jgi:hypothetical protein
MGARQPQPLGERISLLLEISHHVTPHHHQAAASTVQRRNIYFIYSYIDKTGAATEEFPRSSKLASI